MKTFNLILLIVFVFASCNKDNDMNNGKEHPTPLAQENFNFYKSTELYNEAKKMRSENYSDAFEITDIERVGNFLNVTVSYTGNCDTNKFDVIWNEIILESWPPQTHIIIRRTASGCDQADIIKKKILSIDLLELIGDKVLVKEAVFHVSNASKTPDEKNADTIVTTNQ